MTAKKQTSIFCRHLEKSYCENCFNQALLEERSKCAEIEIEMTKWEESDEDWLLFDVIDDEVAVVDQKKRTDPAPGGKESTETDDES